MVYIFFILAKCEEGIQKLKLAEKYSESKVKRVRRQERAKKKLFDSTDDNNSTGDIDEYDEYRRQDKSIENHKAKGIII